MPPSKASTQKKQSRFFYILLLKSFWLHSDHRIKFEFLCQAFKTLLNCSSYLSSFISTSCSHESASTTETVSYSLLTSLHTSTIFPTFECLFHYICHKHWLAFPPQKRQEKILNHTFSFPKWIKLTHLALE